MTLKSHADRAAFCTLLIAIPKPDTGMLLKTVSKTSLSAPASSKAATTISPLIPVWQSI